MLQVGSRFHVGMNNSRDWRQWREGCRGLVWLTRKSGDECIWIGSMLHAKKDTERADKCVGECVLLRSRPWTVNAQKREELWVKEDGKRGKDDSPETCNRVGRFECTVVHVYMSWCAEWLDQGRSADSEFSFAALKWSQTLPAFKVDRGSVGLAYCL